MSRFDSAIVDVDHNKKTVSELCDQQLIPGLSDFISIPNLSPQFDQEWRTNGLLQRAAGCIVEWIKKQDLVGLKEIQIVQDSQNRPPLIFVEIQSTMNDPSDPTILFYGHFDKQPHFNGWREGLGPTSPVIEDGWLYGRGGADDGYASFSSITAIKALQLQKIPHPRCILTIEGEEESGSASYMHYLSLLKDKIGTPNLVICLDSGGLDYENLWITSSLRGYIDGEINVKVLSEGVHSGNGSGIVPSSFRIIRNILDRIEDVDSGRVHESFHVNIPEHRIEQAKNVAAFMGTKIFDSKYKLHGNTQLMTENPYEAYLNKTWRPTISYIGADHLPPVKVAGNVLRPETSLKISMRTPPTLNAFEKGNLLKEIIEKDPPYGSTVTLRDLECGNGWDAPKYRNTLNQSILQASLDYFGRQYQSLGEGGSIPLINELQNMFTQAQFIVTGVLGPGSNAHGPNEGFRIDHLKRILYCVTQIIGDVQKFKNDLSE